MSKIPPYATIRNGYTETVVNLLFALERYEKCDASQPNMKASLLKRCKGLMQHLVDSYLSDHKESRLDERGIDAICIGIGTIAASYNASVSDEARRVFPNGFNKTHLQALDLAAVHQQGEAASHPLR